MMFTTNRYFNPSYVNTIEKDEVYHGKWRLPDKDTSVSGVLNIYKKGGIKLTLIGMFEQDMNNHFDLVEHSIILGTLLPGGGKVTLINCQEQERKGLNDTFSTQKFNTQSLIFNYHVTHIKNLKFSTFEFSTTYLRDWLDIKTTELRFSESKSTLSTLSDSEVRVRHNNNLIKFCSGSRVGGAPGFDYQIREVASFTIECAEPFTIDEFTRLYQQPMIDLVKFGSGLLNSISYCNIILKNESEDIDLRLVQTSEYERITRSKQSVYHHALIRFSAVQNKARFVTGWLKLHHKMAQVFKLYFDSINIGFQFPNARFLSIVQAIESFHAIRNKDNRIKLRMRLGELLKESENLFSSIIEDLDVFQDNVMDTRNYYTHYNPSKGSKAAEGTLLYTLTLCLRLLLAFHFLKECNLDAKGCQKYVREYRIFKHAKTIIDENGFWKISEA